jgi:Cation transporter/ATPase, N-terminus
MTSDSGAERKFWQVALTDLERQLGAGPNGLSSTEAAARRLRYGPNTLEERGVCPCRANSSAGSATRL